MHLISNEQSDLWYRSENLCYFSLDQGHMTNVSLVLPWWLKGLYIVWFRLQMPSKLHYITFYLADGFIQSGVQSCANQRHITNNLTHQIRYNSYRLRSWTYVQYSRWIGQVKLPYRDSYNLRNYSIEININSKSEIRYKIQEPKDRQGKRGKRLGDSCRGVKVQNEEVSLQAAVENGREGAVLMGMGRLFHHWRARVEKLRSRDEWEPVARLAGWASRPVAAERSGRAGVEAWMMSCRYGGAVLLAAV